MTEKARTILIADDEIVYLNCMKRLFGVKFPEYHTEFFSDGGSLKSRLEKGVQEVILVITDNNMPEMTGGEIIEKYACRVNAPRFILYSGDGGDVGRRSLSNGAFAYLKKPADLDDFIDLVKKALGINLLS